MVAQNRSALFQVDGSKVTGLRGWCIPAQGKDYEEKD
jgi:hypothetical protein